MDKFRLDGRKAMVTGGSRGIGFGIARAFVDAGADVVLVARTVEQLRDASNRLQDSGRSVWAYDFDLENTDGVAEFYTRVSKEVGGIDILVNNAGLTRRGPAEDISLEDWRKVIDVDLTSVFALSQAFARERIASGKKGRIVTIGSLVCESVRQHNAPYSAAKGGIRQLTKALAVDWAKYGILVNAIGPGYVKTELTRALWEDPDFDNWVVNRTPVGRWGSPENIADAAVFLASDASDYITGQIIYVDGGFLARF